MQEHIHDDLPGSGPARNAYLRNRIDRVFAPIERDIEEVEIRLSRSTADDERHEVHLVARLTNGTTIEFSGRRRGLADALADAFESAERHLSLTGLAHADWPQDTTGMTGHEFPRPRAGSSKAFRR